MPPTQGETVFVSERSDYTGEVTVSPAVVTHVYTEDDGDPKWWEAAQDKGIVDVTVFPRVGTPRNETVGTAEEQSDEEGNTWYVGYATSPDGFGSSSTSDAETVTDGTVADNDAAQAQAEAVHAQQVQAQAEAVHAQQAQAQTQPDAQPGNVNVPTGWSDSSQS